MVSAVTKYWVTRERARRFVVLERARSRFHAIDALEAARPPILVRQIHRRRAQRPADNAG